jgi:hypothetical protein
MDETAKVVRGREVDLGRCSRKLQEAVKTGAESIVLSCTNGTKSVRERWEHTPERLESLESLLLDAA